jgi:hypothetical protein
VEPSVVEQVATPKVVTPAPLDNSRTVLIFDWDDTLLSSSWLAHMGYRLDYPETIAPDVAHSLSQLQESVVKLLTRAVEVTSDVIIITNAETGWVELSAKRFIPAVVPLLSKVKVFSARSTFEASYPDSPADWKVAAFRQEITRLCANTEAGVTKNVISMGDSIHERLALMKVMQDVTDGLTKSIKFVERPTVEQLKRQVDLVITHLNEIVSHQVPLDLMLTIQLLYSS